MLLALLPRSAGIGIAGRSLPARFRRQKSSRSHRASCACATRGTISFLDYDEASGILLVTVNQVPTSSFIKFFTFFF